MTSRDALGLARLALGVGIGVNLAALGVWKYSGSMIDAWNSLGVFQVSPPGFLLPLGISFYVLQQIGFLLDLRLGRAKTGPLLDYATFIAFFPQLLSGPIVTHRRMEREFKLLKEGRSPEERLAMAAHGIAWVTIGLFKKVVLADTLAVRVFPLVHRAAEHGITALDAWKIALSSGPMIYLDFSGYSDMAVGLGLLFGVRLPYNFNAPARTSSNSSGWRRWHITFHDFMRDHVYRSLQARWGDRPWGVMASVFVVFMISALWHGDGPRFLVWGITTFVIFVFLEKLSLILNPMGKAGLNNLSRYLMFTTMPIIFVAPDLKIASSILLKMGDFSELLFNLSILSMIEGVKIGLLLLLLFSLRFEISTQVLLHRDRAHPDRSFFGYRPPDWTPSWQWAVLLTGMLLVSFALMGQSSLFYYNQF